MKAKPYVGITGFTRPSEVHYTGIVFEEEGFKDAAYLPMFGFLSSSKRLAEPKVSGTKSPAVVDIAALATMTPEFALPMIHYHTQNKDGLADEVKKLFDINDLYASGACRAVQLNVDWPPLEQLAQIYAAMPKLQVVLQIPQRAMEGLGIDEVVRKATGYDGVVQYALIDPSGGLGKLFDIDDDVNLELFSRLSKAMPNTTIGTAGGFSAQNVRGYLKVLNLYAAQEGLDPFSIDIQRRVRHECETASFLDFDNVLLYVQNAAVGLLGKDPAKQFRADRFYDPTIAAMLRSHGK